MKPHSHLCVPGQVSFHPRSWPLTGPSTLLVCPGPLKSLVVPTYATTLGPGHTPAPTGPRDLLLGR